MVYPTCMLCVTVLLMMTCDHPGTIIYMVYDHPIIFGNLLEMVCFQLSSQLNWNLTLKTMSCSLCSVCLVMSCVYMCVCVVCVGVCACVYTCVCITMITRGRGISSY